MQAARQRPPDNTPHPYGSLPASKNSYYGLRTTDYGLRTPFKREDIPP
ncbi:MAG: hypothetical protein AVDCRST_MAG18-2810 [uncultured Thermomicrobiales bacterium]|uniref:Uncharacterized protein n=1 Tax=uncultured Thermomicrobiales bacterium TaxID=1645740 RepID=A0A6J4VGM6_9BACT|nr:MAG: hypothetical protein AVDCRST_MAG18-2810 [uncultured Thermomicrobiales bacterium]